MEPLDQADPEFLGSYQLLARVGEGGMGRVYLARSASGRTVAVKTVRADLAADASFRGRFQREVEAARAVVGPWTAPVLDADTEAAMPWLATGYVLGPPLWRAVSEYGALPERSVCALGAGLAEALIGIHAVGIVHRDLKPANVLLAADGPRVIDFGIARALEGTQITRTGGVVGSPGYMSPEQARGEEIGPGSDVFSLAGVLVFAATGRGPFGEGNASALSYRVMHTAPDLGDLPPALAALLAPCFAQEAADRPSPQQLADQLAPDGASSVLGDGWLPSEVSGAIARHAAKVLELDDPVPTTVAPPVPNPARRKLLLSGVSAGAVVLVGGVLAATLTDRSGQKGTPGRSVRTPSPGVRPGQSFSARPAPRAAGVPPQPLWSAPLNKPVDTEPTVVGGRVLVKTDADVSGAYTATLTALDLATGKVLWSHPGITKHETPPIVVGSAVLDLDTDGNLVRIDIATGKATQIAAKTGTDGPVQVLTADATSAYVLGNYARDGHLDPGTAAYELAAYDLATGRLLWRQVTGDGRIDASLQVTLAGTALVCTDSLHHLTSRRAHDGAQVWSVDLGSWDLSGTPWPKVAVSTPTNTVVTARIKLVAWDLASGRQSWSVPGPDYPCPPLFSPDNTTVYAVRRSDGNSGTVTAVDAHDGTTRWTHPMTDTTDHPLAVSGNTLYISPYLSYGLLALDTRTGAARWTLTDTASNRQWRTTGAPAAGLVLALTDTTLHALPAD